MRAQIKDVHNLLVKREISVTELCNQAFKRIQETSNLNAFITVCKDEASEAAQTLDGKLEAGEGNGFGPLFGVPISIKDNFCTKQLLTTCGSKMLHNFIPPYDATVVTKLKQAGCLITGKTNMDEFAMGSSCTTSYFNFAANSWMSNSLAGEQPGKCDNPKNWYMAGGSSTGSAISVASGACFASIGTDTGGSTRQPASMTGIVGFKPTYGLISRFGLVPLAHCLDVVSLLARSVDDISLIFDQVIGMDDNDLTSVDHRRKLKRVISSDDLSNLTIRIGIPEEFVMKGEPSGAVADKYNEIIRKLSSGSFDQTKFELVNIRLPHTYLATECYTIISSAEIASNMSCYDGVKYGFSVSTDGENFARDDFFKANRDAGFGSEVKKRILLGNYFLLSENREKYLVQAQRLRRLIVEDFVKAFNQSKLDLLLMPSTPTTSISYSDWLSKQDENKLFGEDYYLIPANIANVPSITLPCGLSAAGLPIGLQLLGNKFHDVDLLLIAKFFEKNVLTE